MKKYILFFIAVFIFFTACTGGQTAPPEPAETTAAATDVTSPSVAEEPVTEEDEFDGDGPIIEYIYDEENDIELALNVENLKLTNLFLGVAFTIPENWFFWYLNENNLRVDPAPTVDENILILTENEATGEVYADFFDIGNNDDEFTDEHLGIAARAVKLNGVSLEDYLEEYKEININSENVSLIFEGVNEINGINFSRLVFYILNPYDEYDSRILDTFTVERNGYAVFVKFEAWASYPENEREMMIYMLNYVEFID